MKRKDVLIIGIAAFIAAIFSFVLSGVIFGSPQKNVIKVPVVTKIDSTFPSVQTDTNYTSFFNSKSINPTQLIQIGSSNNQQPFQDSQ